MGIKNWIKPNQNWTDHIKTHLLHPTMSLVCMMGTLNVFCRRQTSLPLSVESGYPLFYLGSNALLITCFRLTHRADDNHGLP